MSAPLGQTIFDGPHSDWQTTLNSTAGPYARASASILGFVNIIRNGCSWRRIDSHEPWHTQEEWLILNEQKQTLNIC